VLKLKSFEEICWWWKFTQLLFQNRDFAVLSPGKP